MSVYLSLTLLGPTLDLNGEGGLSSNNLRMGYVYLAIEHFVLNVHEGSNIPPIHIWGLNIETIEAVAGIDAGRRLHAGHPLHGVTERIFNDDVEGTAHPSSQSSNAPPYQVYNLSLAVSFSCDGSWALAYDCASILGRQQSVISSSLSDAGFEQHPVLLMNLHNFLMDAFRYMYGRTGNVLVLRMNGTVVPGVVSSADGSSVPGMPPVGQAYPSGAFLRWSPFMTSDADAATRAGNSQDHTLDYVIPCLVFLMCGLCLVKYNYDKLRAWVTGEAEFELDGVELVEQGRRGGSGRGHMRSVATKPLLGANEDGDCDGDGSGSGDRSDLKLHLKRTAHYDGFNEVECPGGDVAYSTLCSVPDGQTSKEDEDVEIHFREEIDL